MNKAEQMKHLKDIFQGFLIAFCLLNLEAMGVSYPYLGCFNDLTNGVKDLNGLSIKIKNFKVQTCIRLCRSKGYPYAGAQMGKVCLCGITYGLQGNSLYCNTSCEGVYCGGHNSNDVYYSIDDSLEDSRKMIYHGDKKDFYEARKTCVIGDGDLPSTVNREVVGSISVATTNATDEDTIKDLSVWIGLRKRLQGQLYEWTSAYLPSFDSYNYRASWNPKDDRSGDCVVLRMSNLQWESVSCNQLFPFVCFQISSKLENFNDTDSANNNTTLIERTADQEPPSPLVLYLAMCLFFLCYGGSCVAFCLYKIYLNCFTLKKLAKKSDLSDNSRRGSLYTLLEDYKEENNKNYLLPPTKKDQIYYSKNFFEDNQQHKYIGGVSPHLLSSDPKPKTSAFFKSNKIYPNLYPKLPTDNKVGSFPFNPKNNGKNSAESSKKFKNFRNFNVYK